MLDPKLGIKQPSYKQFLCTIQLLGSTISLIHIQTGSGTSSKWTVLG